jgi:hypothetical protein
VLNCSGFRGRIGGRQRIRQESFFILADGKRLAESKCIPVAQ